MRSDSPLPGEPGHPSTKFSVSHAACTAATVTTFELFTPELSRLAADDKLPAQR